MTDDQVMLFNEYSETLSDFSPISDRIDEFAKFSYKEKPYSTRN